MWIFTAESCLSIVAHRTRPGYLLVRSRGRNDIAAFDPTAEVEHTPEADYPYRATIKRKRVAAILAEEADGIRYDNFKASIKRQPYRAEIYAKVHRFLSKNVTPGWRRPHAPPNPEPMRAFDDTVASVLQ